MGTEEMRHRLPPALRELCLLLGGLPSDLESTAAGCTDIAMPSLRVHPHVMAATYKDDTEYHRHKDSYDGTDNQRMVTALLYLPLVGAPATTGSSVCSIRPSLRARLRILLQSLGVWSCSLRAVCGMR